MSTRPLAQPSFIPEDPGPWSDVLEVMQRRGVRPGHRRGEPPNGLMLTPPPRTGLATVGLDPGVTIAGVAPSRIVAAAREPGVRITISADGSRVTGDSRMVRREWTLPGLALTSEERPATDPAADIPAPAPLESLAAGELPAHAVDVGDGLYVGVPVAEGRSIGVAILRVADRGLVRYVRGARSVAWTPDAATMIVGGEWGLLALTLAP